MVTQHSSHAGAARRSPWSEVKAVDGLGSHRGNMLKKGVWAIHLLCGSPHMPISRNCLAFLQDLAVHSACPGLWLAAALHLPLKRCGRSCCSYQPLQGTNIPAVTMVLFPSLLSKSRDVHLLSQGSVPGEGPLILLALHWRVG